MLTAFSVMYELRLSQDKHRERDVLPFARKVWENQYLPFSNKVQEIRYLDFYEMSTRSKALPKRPLKRLTIQRNYHAAQKKRRFAFNPYRTNVENRVSS